MHPHNTTPYIDVANYSQVELEAGAINFDDPDTAKMVNAEGTRAHQPRSLIVTHAGGGTLCFKTDASHSRSEVRHVHGLTAGAQLQPDHMLVLRSIELESADADVLAWWSVDDYTQTSTFTGWTNDTTDANDEGAADVLMMPSSETQDEDGFIVMFSEPTNALRFVLSTLGTDGVIGWQYYDGAATYDASFSALTVTGAAANLLASGDVVWTPPADWTPCTINGVGPGYAVLGLVTTVFTVNPIGTQIRALNKTNVAGIRVAA